MDTSSNGPRAWRRGNQPALLLAAASSLAAAVLILFAAALFLFRQFVFRIPLLRRWGLLLPLLGAGVCLQLGRALLRAALRSPGRYCGEDLPALQAMVVHPNDAGKMLDDSPLAVPNAAADPGRHQDRGGQLFFFIHGWPDDLSTWVDTITMLHAAHPKAKCVAIALPHCPTDDHKGATDHRPTLSQLLRQTDFPAVVEALRRSMVAHGASATNPAVVIAHDWGASYAFRLQAESPALVDRLVCVDVGAHVAWTPPQWRGILRYQLPISAAFLLERGDNNDGMSWTSTSPWTLPVGYTARLAGALGAPEPGKPPAVNYPYFWFHLRLLANLLQLGSGAGFPDVTGDHLDSGRAVPSCPLLYVYGTQKGNPPIHFHSDAWVAQVADTPGCRVLAVASGHWVQNKATAELCHAVSAFLRSNPSDVGRPRQTAQPPPGLTDYQLDFIIETGLLLLAALVAVDLPLAGSWWRALVDTAFFRAALFFWGGRVVSSAMDLGLPVAPGGEWLRGHDFGSRSHQVKRRLAAVCGSVFGARQQYRMQVIASDPAVMLAITGPGSGADRRSRFQDSLERVLTSGVPSIFTLPEGGEWSTRRKSAVGFFAPANLQAFVPEIRSRLGECDAVLLRHSLPPSAAAPTTTVDLSELMIRFTFDVIGDLVLDHDFGAVRSGGSDVQVLIATLISETIARMYSPWRKWTPAGAAGNEAQQALWEFGRRCVQDYVAAGTTPAGAESTPAAPSCRGGRHLIGHMPWMQRCVHGGVHGGAPLTPEELDATVADLITFLVAGHETTGHTLAWTLWLTSTHPEIEQKLLDELASTPPGCRAEENDYLAAVINESMRLKPASANGTGRVLKRDLWVAPHGCPALKLAKGQAVNCAFFTAHTAEATWGADAGDFRPERWLQRRGNTTAAHTAGSAAAHHERQGHFMPFSSGPRNCAGRNLAMLEIKTALVHLLRKWRFVPDPRSPVDERCGINLEPRGIKVAVRPRGTRLPGG